MKLFVASVGAALAQIDSSSANTMVTVDVVGLHDYIEAGTSTNLTCSWTLPVDADAEFNENDFQLFWKLDINENNHKSLLSWRAGDDEATTYKTNYAKGLIFEQNFDGQSANLFIPDVDIQHDGLSYSCEVHWGGTYGENNVDLTVYQNAEAVELLSITESLEGRDQLIGNETMAAPESYDVAECTVRSIYPEPATVTFQLNGVEHPVDASEVTPNADGTFDATATLSLAPEGQFDGAQVSCISVAAPTAETIENDEESTFPVEVFYYTDEVSIEVNGAATAITDEDYYVIEGHSYQVSCQANGNPAPLVKIARIDGTEISSADDIVAVRNDKVQLTCEASNDSPANETYTLGQAVSDVATIDVYYIDSPVAGADDQATYDTEYKKTCSASGNPAPKIQWTRAGSSSVISEKELVLGKVTYSDEAEYTCTATNTAGSQFDSFFLTVDGPCVVRTEEPIAGTSGEGEHASLSIKCVVDGPRENACKITWTGPIGLEDVFATSKQLEKPDGSVLSFSNLVKLNEPTEFTCSASNSYGKTSATAQVDEENEPACCQPNRQASLGTGAIVGIVIAIPAILIILGAAVFFCRKQQQDKDDTCVEEGDDAADAEKQPLQASEPDGEGGDAGDDAV